MELPLEDDGKAESDSHVGGANMDSTSQGGYDVPPPPPHGTPIPASPEPEEK